MLPMLPKNISSVFLPKRRYFPISQRTECAKQSLEFRLAALVIIGRNSIKFDCYETVCRKGAVPCGERWLLFPHSWSKLMPPSPPTDPAPTAAPSPCISRVPISEVSPILTTVYFSISYIDCPVPVSAARWITASMPSRARNQSLRSVRPPWIKRTQSLILRYKGDVYSRFSP